MNRVFRIVWSRARRIWIVASEFASQGGRGGIESARRSLAAVRAYEREFRISGLRLAIASALLASAAPAGAADQYWDVNGNTAGLGGTGTWNLTNSLWNSSSTGTGGTLSAWNNAALDDAFFGGTAGTVTLTVPITVHNITFQSSGYTIGGSTLTLGGVSPQISYTGANQATINSVLAGSNGLTVNGGSTNGYLILGGSNILTGGITVNSGARLIGSGSNSFNGAGNVVTVNSGGALQINHSNAFGGNTSAANLVLNSGANLWLGNQNLTHDITAHGGTIVISDPFGGGNSTWTGNLALTANTTVLVNNTGDNDNLFFAGNLTDTGANRLSLEMNEAGGIDSSLFLTGTNSFTGGITVNSGQLFLSGNDSAAAAAGNVVTINGGILRVENNNAFGGDTAASRLVINSGGRFRIGTSLNVTHDVTLTGGTSFIDGLGNATWNGTAVLTANTTLGLGVNAHRLNVTGNLADSGGNVLSLSVGSGEQHFTGNLSFSGAMTIVGGTTYLDGGSNTYSGDTILRGTLVLNSATAVSPNTSFRFENGSLYGTSAFPNITFGLGTGDGQISWNGGFGAFYAFSNQSDVTVNLGGASAPLTWASGGFVPDGQPLILGTNGSGSAARQLDFQNPIDFNGAVRAVRADNGSIADHVVLSGQLTNGGLQIVGTGAVELTNTGNTYAGATIVGDAASASGNLILNSAGTLSPNSNLQLNGLAGVTEMVSHGGYVLVTAASGPFTRSLGTGAGQVQWTASGGFGAIGAPRTVDIGGVGATLTWGNGGFVPTGAALRFGGVFANSMVNWQNGIDLGAIDRTINVNEGQGAGWQSASELEVGLNGVIQGSGGLRLVGAGDVALNALNTYSGTTYIGGIGVGGTGDTMWAWANTLADTGVASSLGTGANVVLNSHVGGLIYTGGVTSTNRTLSLNRTSGAVHHLFNYGTGALTWAGNITTTGTGQNDLRLGGTYATTTNASSVAVAPNVISGVISDGSGTTRVRGWNSGSCTTGGVWRLTGANTFTSGIMPDGCVIEVTTIGNIGVASAVGGGNLIADYRSSDGTLRYVGSGDTSDRLFWTWANSRLESSGTGPLALTNPGLVVSQNGGFTLSLGGSNTGENTLAATLVDSPLPVEFANSWFRLLKDGPGLWALSTDNNARPNAYSGMTRIFGGALRLDHAGAITGGLGVTSSHGATGSSQRSSVIRFEGAADGSGGVLGLTAASGGFFRGLTTAGGEAFQNNNGTTIGVDPDGAGPLPAYGLEALDDDNYVQGVRWFNSGGFAAWDGTQTVNLFGDAREVTWGAGGFVPTNHQLVFGYVTADGTVDFRNAINLGGAARTVHVNNGLADRDALMSGVLRSTTVLGGLTKTGAGTLSLTANNSYTGVTTVSAGTLEVGDGGTTGTLGNGTQAVVAAGATLAANRSNAYTLNQNVNGDGTLVQRGTGTTTMTVNSDIDHVVMEHGRLVTPGSLFANDITFSNDGGATLQVTGTLRTAAATSTLITGGTGVDTVQVGTGASVLANGGLGDGNDTLDVAGTLNTGAGTFDLAGGDDTFVVRDNTNVIGTVIGGAGVDTLNTNIATTANLQVVQTFETLTKTGAGTLNVNGPGTSDFSTINVNAGTLNVAAGSDVSATVGGTLTATVATGATLNVNGAFGCGAGNDSLTIAGNVAGTGTIDQCGGDDLLTLQDGANVGGYAGVLDGGAHGGAAGDTVQLDIATLLNFAQGTVTNYESLLKSNAGTATLSGAHIYSAGTAISGGTLDVDGSLTTPTIAFTNTTGAATLNVDGTAQASGATQTAITGSAATNIVNVNVGGTLLASGDLGGGADVLDVAGSLNTGGGVFALADGDDDFIIHDGTSLIGTVDGGAGFDSLNANIAGLADLGAVSTFEELVKSGAGTLNINGPAPSDFVAVDVQAGTLNIAPAGSLTAIQSATVAGGATLVVDGSLQFTPGADLFTVAGEVRGLSSIDMLDGADALTIQDGADLSGLATSISGGAGTDTLNADIAGSATLGGAVDFETLIKTNVGTFHILGAAPSQFDTVLVQGGTLHVGAGAVVDPQTTAVSAGATMTVDGTYTGTLGDDTFTVSGTVDGAGTIDLLAGDDVLTINDTGVIDGLTNPLDGGSHTPAGDSVVLDFASDRAFAGDDVVNFENLLKQSTGTVTMTGSSAFSGGTTLSGGGLAVAGTLETPIVTMANDTALDVDGTLQAAGGTAANITGSAGVNTLTIGSSGTLLASGDLGAGADVLDVAGTLNTGGGVFALADGDDDFIIHDGTGLIGTVDGGTGFDGLNANIAGVADLGAVSTFEELVKSGAGTLNINGPASSDFVAVDVQAGTLDIAATGSLNDIQAATVASGATLVVDGTLSFTAGADLFTVAGEVSGLSTIDMLDGADTLTIRDGADLDGLVTSISGGAGTDTLNADIAGSATLGGAIDFEALIKTNVGTLHVDGPASSAFNAVAVDGGTLEIGPASALSGVATTTVATGAVLNVAGAYTGSAGADTFTVSGTISGTGTIGLLAGDDVLTINDAGVINGLTNPLDGGAHTPAGDSVVLNFASDRAFAGDDVINFENLVKQGGGTVTMTGSSTFSGGAIVSGGGLTVAGALQTPTVSLADNTALNVNGSLDAGGGVASSITGTAGTNTVTVGTGASLLASGDLGAGADTLDVLGLLDVNGGAFLLGDGDDNFVVHDNTVVAGTVDGGAGFDTRTYDINASATVGALVNFEGVTKTGTGVLTITGPGATELGAVDVLGGTLNIGLSGSVAAPSGNTLDTLIAAGATLQVDGSYGCGAGNDTLNVSGTVSGAGTIDLCGGEDTLTLNDGAALAAVVSGGSHGSGDTVVLNNANALSLDAAVTVNFEMLTKQNTGTATLVGTQSWSQVDVDGGTLAVNGTLFAPNIALADATVLSVATGGVVDASAAPGDAAVINGSAGANTVTVATGAALRASGDLGDGVDVLDVAGALDTDGSVFALGAGNDVFVVHDTTSVSGTVDGGLGNDLLNVTISSGNTVPLGSMLGFESLGKSGPGTLQINGPSTFIDVDLMAGLLEVTAGGSVSAQNTTVAAGSTLRVDGSYAGTGGNDTMLVAGTITGAGTVALGDGSDSFTVQDGANLTGLATPVDGGAGIDAFIADLTGNATLGSAINFETLTKSNTGTLHVDGPAASTFSIVNVNGGTLDIGAAGSIGGVTTTAIASSATLQVNGGYVGTAGNDTMTLSGTLAGAGSIDLQGGDDVFTLNTGATVTYTGVVDAAGASADRFVLAGAGTGTFDLGLVGTVFQNFEGFAKEGAGTWRLSGAGNQDWTVSQGTLIGDSTSFGGDIANFGTVIFDQPADGTFAGVLSGNGALVKQNVGTLVMTGTSTFAGNTQLAAGGLQIDGTLPGAMIVASGATLSGVGIAGNVSGEAGAFINPGNAATPFGTLTLAGDYAGGATVTVNTQLGDSSSSTSRLVIRGSTSGANSPVLVNRASGDGAQTVGDGISIIQVDGASPSGSFRLMQPVQAGAYEYLLYQGGAADANDWFLRSELTNPQEQPLPSFRPAVAGYVLGHQANLEYGFAALGNLRARVGDQGRIPDLQSAQRAQAWMRVAAHELDIGGSRFEAQDFRMDMLQFGTDIYTRETGDGGARLGVMASVGESRATFLDPERAIAGLSPRAGDMDADVKGAGVYWTGFRESGAYLDVAAQFLYYRNSYSDQFFATSRQSGWGGTVAAELGSTFVLGNSGWRIEPHLQAGFQQLALDDFDDDISTISAVDESAVRARAGVQLFRAPAHWLGMSDASPYLGLGVQKDFEEAESISVGATALRDEIPGTTADFSVGFTGSVQPGVELHFDVRYQQATQGERDGLRANFGFRAQF